MRALLAAAVLVLGVPLAACESKPSPPPPNPVPDGAEAVLRPPPPPAVAPLVTTACAQRFVRRADDNAAEGGTENSGRRAVAFLNRCGFPIRILYAERPGGRFSKLTEMLRPGETSNFAGIEDGFDQPGYVVCSYEAVPSSHACRLGRGRGR